jgi:AcrR family transcriptional regulator
MTSDGLRRNHLTIRANALTPTRGRPRALEREAVIAHALQVVDNEGLGALTVRRLAGDLGVGAATIAATAGSKDEILGALVDLVMSSVPEVEVVPERWAATLEDLFVTIHELLLEHPAVAQLAVLQPTTGPVIVQTQETILALLTCGGLDGPDVVTAYTALTSYLMGFTLLRISRSEPSPRRTPRSYERPPLVAELQPYLDQQTSPAQFLAGLRKLLGPDASSAR